MKSPRHRSSATRRGSASGRRLVVPGRREHRSDGWSIANIPSPLALERWYHVERVGHSRCPVGHHLETGEHNTYLLQFLHAGELEHLIRNRRHLVRAGEACLIDLAEPGAHHNHGPRRADLYWVSFHGPDLEWWFEHLQARAAPVFAGVDRPYMTRVFRELIGLTEQRPPGYEPRTSMLLGSLLAELHAVRERANPRFGRDRQRTAYSAPIHAALQLMFVRYSNPLKLRDISRVSGLSLHGFVHRFQQEIGLPPMAWLARFRIERAREQLAHTHRPIREIARLVGVPDPAHFAHLFRQLTGASPRQYRHRPESAPALLLRRPTRRPANQTV